MSLKKTLAWKWFALYIKIRDGWTCVTCWKKARGRGMGAGHFIQAHGHQNTFFDETNVHAQCSRCNGWDTTSLLRYRRAIIKKYGAGYDRKLEKLGNKYKQWSKKELKEIAERYKKEVEFQKSLGNT